MPVNFALTQDLQNKIIFPNIRIIRVSSYILKAYSVSKQRLYIVRHLKSNVLDQQIFAYYIVLRQSSILFLM